MTARLLLLALALCACRPDAEVPLGDDIVHPNGLLAAPPAGFEASLTPTGFAFVEAGALRSPLRIGIDLAAAPPALAGDRGRTLGGERVGYVVSETGGGSGGAEHALTAVRIVDGRAVVLTAHDQSEGAPDFAAAWAVLGHAAIR